MANNRLYLYIQINEIIRFYSNVKLLDARFGVFINVARMNHTEIPGDRQLFTKTIIGEPIFVNTAATIETVNIDYTCQLYQVQQTLATTHSRTEKLYYTNKPIATDEMGMVGMK